MSRGHKESQPISRPSVGAYPSLHRRFMAPQRVLLTGAEVHSWSPWPFTASQWLFLSPLKKIICPPLQTPACLPTALCHFKEAFSVFTGFSPALSLHSCCSSSFPLSSHSAAKHGLQANHSNYASLSPVQWHHSCQHKKIQGINKEPLQ